ncbi:hypothetical protein D6779_05735 [Candidatus Parcubacteria bacterium]|nr:MAG: hypothetical protein D6779_05735 [Candidatus Parcubacteria bacterium]
MRWVRRYAFWAALRVLPVSHVERYGTASPGRSDRPERLSCYFNCITFGMSPLQKRIHRGDRKVRREKI